MKPTILNISTQKPHSTGSGTYLTELVKSWDRMGIRQGVVAGQYIDDDTHFPPDVTFYPVYYNEFPGKELDALDPSVCHLNFPVVGMSDVMPYTSTRYMDLTPEMINDIRNAFVPVIRQAIEDINPDIIVCHHLFLLTAIVREEFPDNTVFGVCHGSDLRQMANLRDEYENYSYENIDPEFIARNIAALDEVMLLSDAQIPKAEKLYGVPRNKIHVIGTGYNKDIFNMNESTGNCADKDAIKDGDTSANDSKAKENTGGSEMSGEVRVIFAGKICQEKGIPELLAALDIVCSEPGAPRVRLLLAGGCKDELVKSRLLDMKDELSSDGLHEAKDCSCRTLEPGILQEEPFVVEYLGILPQKRLAEEFRRADVFVLPSYYEGLPLVLIEAMAAGLETVSNDLPGVKGWLEATVPDANTVFVQMPKLCGIDKPDPEYVHEYVDALAAALKDRIDYCAEHEKDSRPHPDTSDATWDAVAKKIINAWRDN